MDERRAQLADKLGVKAYVARVAPEARTADVLTVASRGEDLDTHDLPDVCVLKANNGYARNLVLRAPHDRDAIVQQANAWLAQDPCEGLFPWESHYRSIPPRVFIEEFLSEDGNASLTDYKVFVLHGTPALVRVMGDRTQNRFSRGVFSVDWQRLDAFREPLPWQDAHASVAMADIPKPPLLPQLLQVSEKLAAGMPFVSVDAYLIHGAVYVGELTFSPAGGAVPFPYAFDVALGRQLKVG